MTAADLFAPYRLWLAGYPLDRDWLNAQVVAAGIRTGNGQPLRFVTPGITEGYEERAWHHGEVDTRLENWHDAFNALVWLRFPQTKAVINRRHWHSLDERRARGESGRGPLRDALTQFDECGVIVACAEPSLWQDLRAHRWRRLFVERRDEVALAMEFIVFGHASLDALQAPFVGLCGKALCFEVAADWFGRDAATRWAGMDALLAQRLTEADLVPRDLQALPLLGIPGVVAENADPAYYDDQRQFRPARAYPAC
ncbi:MAG: DUF3025 domain-containing protein [Rhodocyclaceae bacterium]|nr:DUF3025 domain-containing protein [Rhodocyclaceae bacterium]